MKILYVAKHGCGGNQDEDAISHALRALGHDVVKEKEASSSIKPISNLSRSADLLLSHKWDDLEAISVNDAKVKAFWHFDLINHPDPSLQERCRSRLRWMERILPHVDLGFCCDGDYVDVKRFHSDKLRWLMQGADERIVGRGSPRPMPLDRLPQHLRGPDILFVGSVRGCGEGRASFVDEMRKRWGDRFHHVEHGLHRELLREVISRTRIVVAPDHPVTDRYFSNRIFLMLGFGAFLLHPASKAAEEMFKDGEEVVFYRSRDELHDMIELALTLGSSKILGGGVTGVAKAGLERIKKEHLYRHRCIQLIKEVEGVLVQKGFEGVSS